MTRISLISAPLALLIFPACSSRADYLDDTGYRALAAELGSSLPTGQGVGLTQVESADSDYLPEPGNGAFPAESTFFSGLVFQARSGASGLSGHAEQVGEHMYGRNQNPNLGRMGFTPGITVADIYRTSGADATAWLGSGWLVPGSAPPLTETQAVQNHSWISTGAAVTATAHKEKLRRLDFAILRDGFLAVTGVNNGAGTEVPALMSSAYNNLAAGLSTGEHSRGGVLAYLDGEGRQKPEIVTPLDYTSFSTGLVSSAAAFLRQTANTQGEHARSPETLKAILLAGATKEEFPGWSRTATAPLDPVFGAGELHLGNSWHILAGGEQGANQSAGVPDRAWAYVTLTTSTAADFLFTIQDGRIGETFSAMAVWNRIITDNNPGSGFTASVATLANYNLLLQRVSADGGAVTVDQSISTIENLEHIYQRNLMPGTYRLRLNLASGSKVPAAVAWRLSTIPHEPRIFLTRTDGNDTLNFTGLVPGLPYIIQGSATASNWTVTQEFTAEDTTFTWSAPQTGRRWFYRLAAGGR